MHKAITIDRDVRVISAKRRLMILHRLKLDEATTNANALCIQNENLNQLCHVSTACAMIRKDLYVRRQEAAGKKKLYFHAYSKGLLCLTTKLRSNQ